MAVLTAMVMWTAAAVPGPAQDPPPVGYVSKDRVVELAQAADPSIAAFVPAAAAVTSFAALVDPVHIRVFFCAARPADLKLAAAIGLATAAAVNPALTVELIAVAENLSEPAALISENSVTKAPEVIVFWMNQEIARVHPDPASAVETDLADLIFQVRTQIAQDMVLDHDFFKFTYHKDLLSLDCKRCHGPAGRERTIGSDHRQNRGTVRSSTSGEYLNRALAGIPSNSDS